MDNTNVSASASAPTTTTTTTTNVQAPIGYPPNAPLLPPSLVLPILDFSRNES